MSSVTLHRRLVVLLATAALTLAACGPVPALQISGQPEPHGDAAPTTATAQQGRPDDADAVRTAGPTERDADERPARTAHRPDRADRSATTPPRDPEEPTAASRPSRGDRGPEVHALQERLTELGYWLGEPDGHFGTLTRQAVLAFQGWNGLPRDGVVGPQTRQALKDAARPRPDHGGDLIEIHRDSQVLLIVRDGKTRWALHTSTGTGQRYTRPDGDVAVADTPAGTWEISWQVDGWRNSDLGRLWRPKYFHRDGLAIHGYPEVPAHPASHGCARVSMQAMDLIWEQDLAPQGTTVIVH